MARKNQQEQPEPRHGGAGGAPGSGTPYGGLVAPLSPLGTTPGDTRAPCGVPWCPRYTGVPDPLGTDCGCPPAPAAAAAPAAAPAATATPPPPTAAAAPILATIGKQISITIEKTMNKDEKLINVILGTRRTVRVARRGRCEERPTTTPSGPLPQLQDR